MFFFTPMSGFFRTKETAGKRLKVNLGIVSSLECIIMHSFYTVRVMRALFSGISQRNLAIVNADMKITCLLPTDISAVVKLVKFSKCSCAKGLVFETTPPDLKKSLSKVLHRR